MSFTAHPGSILKEELEVLGLSADDLAQAIGVPASSISGLICKTKSITPDTAIRLSAYFGGAPAFWVNMQAAYDLAKYEAEKGEEVRSQVRKPSA